MKKQCKTAFSLVELSVVILIIGVVLAGITQSSRLIREFKLSSARTLTRSSPVASISDLVAWFDATNEESTVGATSSDYELDNGDEVLTWKSIIESGTNFSVTADSGKGPQFVDEGINELPALLFDKSDIDERLTGSFVGRSFELTIFLVIKKVSTNVLSTDVVAIGGPSGYATIVALNSSGNLNAYSYFDPSTVGQVLSDSALSDSTNYLISYVHSPSTTKARLYLDKTRQDSATNTTTSDPGQTSQDFTIGAHVNVDDRVFDGYIGEVIVYNRALRTEERVAVEDYLNKKWDL